MPSTAEVLVVGAGPTGLTFAAALAAHCYGAARRPVAERVVALADRLTRLATVRRCWRPVRNALLRTVSRVPAVRARLAWDLSGLANR